MKKLEEKTREELIKDARESRKWENRKAWLNLIGSSILLIILAVGLYLKLR